MIFNKMDGADPFRYLEFVKARDEYFSDIAHKSTRKWVEEKTGIHFGWPAKRNGRTQADHLRRVNRRRKIDHDEFGDPYGGGRPKGSGTKQKQVAAWRAEHPDGKKVDCIRDTGLTKPTVYKWWNS